MYFRFSSQLNGSCLPSKAQNYSKFVNVATQRTKQKINCDVCEDILKAMIVPDNNINCNDQQRKINIIYLSMAI